MSNFKKRRITKKRNKALANFFAKAGCIFAIVALPPVGFAILYTYAASLPY